MWQMCRHAAKHAKKGCKKDKRTYLYHWPAPQRAKQTARNTKNLIRMKHRTLGKNGPEVSEIGFGAWGIGGGWGKQDDAEALKTLEKALEKGITFYDTALAYGDGHSEKLIGQALAGVRGQVVIASKIPPKTMQWPVLDEHPLSATFPADWIVACTEKSLSNLGTDYLDLMQLHAWAPSYETQDEWLKALQQLKEQGKIRAIGVSVNDWDAYGGTGLAESGLVDSIQVIYNIFEQRPAEELFPAALKSGTGIIVRVPFEEGLLTGSFGPNHVFDEGDWRAEWLTKDRLRQAHARVEFLKEFLSEDCPDLATLALKFCLSHPAVSTVIPGMRKTAHVAANTLAADGFFLPDTTLNELSAHAFTHGWFYPWSKL